jgi:hypothetical protein
MLHLYRNSVHLNMHVKIQKYFAGGIIIINLYIAFAFPQFSSSTFGTECFFMEFDGSFLQRYGVKLYTVRYHVGGWIE